MSAPLRASANFLQSAKNSNLFNGSGAELIPADAQQADHLSITYAEATQQTPQLRAMLKDPESTATLVKRLAQSEQSFAVRSGGHCFAGFSQHPELVLDLRQLNQISLDHNNGQVTVGAGAKLGQLYSALAPYGRTVPGGTQGNVGLGGHVLGGGFGYFSRKAGMLCDNLLSLKIALAAGVTIEASPRIHSDLFWACQGGGGGNFGIVTEFKFQTMNVNELHVIDLTETASPQRTARILYNWQYWSRLAPKHTTHLAFSKLADNQFLLRLTGISEEKERAILMRELGQLFSRTEPIHPNYVKSGYYEDLAKTLYPKPSVFGGIFFARSEYLNAPISKEGIWQFVQTMMRYPPNATKFVFEALGGAIADRATTDTAFPHRQAEILIQMTGELQNETQRPAREASMNHAARTLAPYVTGGTYVNYPDLSLKNWQKAYWGENFERLQQVKRRYDPGNVFRHAQSVPV